MTGTLLKKELRHHGVVVGLSIFAGWVLFVAFWGSARLASPASGSVLEPIPIFAQWGFWIILVIGCRRLVVNEYLEKTHLFLESLPLPRTRFLIVKYLFGLVAALAVMLGALAFCIVVGIRTEDFTPRFLLILFARASVFTFCAFGFFFLMGFFGRLRFTLYLALGIILLLGKSVADWKVSKFPALNLILDRFAFERVHFPVDDLLVTGGLGIAFFLVALVLATVSGGSLVNAIGGRLSYGEKVTVFALILVCVSVLFVASEKQEKQPFDLQDASAATTRGTVVKVGPESEVHDVLAQELADSLADLRDFLGYEVDEFPPVFLIDRPDLEHYELEDGMLMFDEGLIVRGNLNSPDFSRDRLIAHCVERILARMTTWRSHRESRTWITSGFAQWWSRRAGGENNTHDLRLRAAYLWAGRGEGAELDRRDLEDWESTNDGPGTEVSDGLAWAGIDLIVEESEGGEDGLREWLRAVFRPVENRHAGVNLREWLSPDTRLLRRHTGLGMNDLVEQLGARLDAWVVELADEVAKLPRIEADFGYEHSAGSSYRGTYLATVPDPGSGVGALEDPRLQYASLDPFSYAEWVGNFSHDRLYFGEGGGTLRGYLGGDYPEGTRIAATFTAWQPDMKCEIISGWERPYAGE